MHKHACLQIEVITPGNGEKPIKGQRVQVHYICTLASNGKHVDSSRDRGQPHSFTLGMGQVAIKGLVPPNSDLIVDMELLSFE
eukprot:jgi/Astpho2/9031/Aster-x1559